MTNILFICTGNTCRSPMAEAILRNKQNDQIEVRSAGVFAFDGSPASTNTKKVLEENNISHSHTSSLLKEEDVKWATYIFTMTSGHKATVLNMFPQAGDKTFTLNEFVDGKGLDVADPYGGSVEIYRETFGELDKLIDKLLDKLNKGL
ncbi:low molecular weight protein arginine phosphatase [Falsibacillus albus]|uniref:Low molecular weight protein arginine phosphatase n=1 Tax=Falsibacillus albus TaxID=2478915 RepID=A0A3L7JRR8_9BACI|nr:low molecular weight protein arginine phosphatase [Falsibacillus albus]RLQ93503.1 low molecular weight protein arginine phosphatase [Falsibacillus albus]